MKSKSIFVQVLILCLLVTSFNSYAADKVQIKLISFAPVPKKALFTVMVKDENAKEGGEPFKAVVDPFSIDSRCFTLPMQVKRQPSILACPAANGESAKALAIMKFPTTGKKFIGILVPDKTAKSKFRVVIINASNESFGDGEVLCYNFMQEDIHAAISGKRYMIRARASYLYKPEKKQNWGTYSAKFYTKEKGKFSIFRSAAWPFMKNKRTLVFFYRDKTSTHPQMRAVDEYDDWLKAKANAGGLRE